jgi:hypothetical protein
MEKELKRNNENEEEKNKRKKEVEGEAFLVYLITQSIWFQGDVLGNQRIGDPLPAEWKILLVPLASTPVQIPIPLQCMMK